MLKNPWWQATAWMIAVNVVVMGVALYWDWIKPEDWVGWIQAVGTVEAIIAAVFIAQAEHWNAKHESESEVEKRRIGLITLILPELLRLHGWSKEGRRIFVEIEQHKTELVHTVRRINCDPAPPVMMDRFADQLNLLGGDLMHITVQVLAMVRNMMQLAPTTFQAGPSLEVNMADETGRDVVAFYKRQFEALDMILMGLVKLLVEQHPNFIAPISMNKARAEALRERI
jgi:hypothetical protein